MTTLSMVYTRSVSQFDDYSAVALFSFAGLIGSFCVGMLGIDLNLSASLL